MRYECDGKLFQISGGITSATNERCLVVDYDSALATIEIRDQKRKGETVTYCVFGRMLISEHTEPKSAIEAACRTALAVYAAREKIRPQREAAWDRLWDYAKNEDVLA